METQLTQLETMQDLAMQSLMIYAFNYEYNFIDIVWGDDENLKKHLKGKFYDAGNFANFYMMLSVGNKRKLNKHILTLEL